MHNWSIAAAGVATLGLSASWAHAQTAESINGRARSITLGAAINAAVQTNPELARTEVDRKIAESDTLEAAGSDDWVFSAIGTWHSSRAGAIEGTPFQVTLTDRLSASSSLTRALRSGGTFGIHADGGFTRNEYTFIDGEGDTGTQLTQAYNVGVAASIRQPLLRGRGQRVARANVRRAAIAKDGATLAKQVQAIAMVTDIIHAYWELAYAARALQIRRAAVALAKKQLAITNSALAVGSKAASDVRAVEHGIAVREQAVLQARTDVSQRSLELRRLSGLEIGPGDIDLVAATPLKVEKRRFDLDQSLSVARERNPRIALLRVRGKQANIDTEVARDGRRSALDLTARIGPTGDSGDAGDMAKQFVTFDSFSATATLNYQRTAGNRSATANYQRMRLHRQQVRLELAQTERDISVQLVQAINQVRVARKRIEVGDKAIKLAQSNLADETLRFNNNEATNFDVLQRQNDIQSAELEKTRAIVDYLKALAVVDSLTADLLPRYGVTTL